MRTLTDRIAVAIPPEERQPLEELAASLGVSKGRVVRVALHRLYGTEPAEIHAEIRSLIGREWRRRQSIEEAAPIG